MGAPQSAATATATLQSVVSTAVVALWLYPTPSLRLDGAATSDDAPHGAAVVRSRVILAQSRARVVH